MATTDFTEWVVPDLILTLGGRSYAVRPPSVDRAKRILALAIHSDAQTAGQEVPVDIAETVESLSDTPLAVVTLGQDVYDQLAFDEVPQEVIRRMGYYALRYWVSGKERADEVARLLWAAAPEEAGADPKARTSVPRPRSRSGRSTASGPRTRTASTPTTGFPPD